MLQQKATNSSYPSRSHKRTHKKTPLSCVSSEAAFFNPWVAKPHLWDRGNLSSPMQERASISPVMGLPYQNGVLTIILRSRFSLSCPAAPKACPAEAAASQGCYEDTRWGKLGRQEVGGGGWVDQVPESAGGSKSHTLFVGIMTCERLKTTSLKVSLSVHGLLLLLCSIVTSHAAATKHLQ